MEPSASAAAVRVRRVSRMRRFGADWGSGADTAAVAAVSAGSPAASCIFTRSKVELSTGTVAELMAEFAVEKMDRRARRFTFRYFGQKLSGPRAGLLDTRISPLHPDVQR